MNFKIGPYLIDPAAVLAPMAGVTDRPFRQLCRRLGAGHVVSEMVASNPRLRNTRKSRWRRDHSGEPAPITVQIVGGDAAILAQAARENVREGAQIIDINMGCPAKKVCRKAAGSALLANEPLVREILETVVDAVDVPVTLKIRTGSDPDHRNALTIAALAEAAGIQALAVHGRTRACRFKGQAEYETIRQIKQAVNIPVIANGDINSAAEARQVMALTGADGVMLGRGAQGNPWLFAAVAAALKGQPAPAPPSREQVGLVMLDHLRAVHQHYGAEAGVRVARKHLSWYLKQHGEQALQPGSDTSSLRQRLLRVEHADEQLSLVANHFLGDGPSSSANKPGQGRQAA